MRISTYLLDVETQRDLFVPGGSCFTAASGRAGEQIVRLFAAANRAGWNVISTVLRQKPDREGLLVPGIPHCIEGTPGEMKLPGTLIAPVTDLGMRESTDIPIDLFHRFRQAVFEKRYSTDIFSHRRPERLLSEMLPSQFILCGAGISRGILQAAIGLRVFGHAVVYVKDACIEPGMPRVSNAVLRMATKGVVIATAEEVISRAFEQACFRECSVLPISDHVDNGTGMERQAPPGLDRGFFPDQGAPRAAAQRGGAAGGDGRLAADGSLHAFRLPASKRGAG